ncbi:MAG: glycosyltransferase family 2 protein [Saprospiraceae bacterium]|nr:glycosyltransferase family 2 protein [Saprospiraceae bacterium]
MTMVSIIVPCFDQAKYLNDALTSVINQSYSDWECIIVDDGSPDHTAEVASEWLKKDDRFSFIHQENQGLSAARNTGISRAKGTYILPLDADDKISKDYVALAVEAFKNDESLTVVYCDAEYFGEKTGPWKLNPYSFLELLRYNSIFCSAFFKAKDWKRVGGYDPEMKYGLEDWEFWIHVLKAGGTVKKLDHLGFYYRIKTESMISNMTEDKVAYSQNYVWNKHRDIYLKNYDWLLKEHKDIKVKLKSRKFALNLVMKRFFGFTIFKNKSA